MTPPAQAILLAACELAQITQDGKVSIMGIFSRLSAVQLPLKVPRFFLVGIIKGEPLSKHNVSFQIIGPSTQESIQEYQASISLGYDGRANVVNELTNTTFKDFGEYQIVLNINGHKQSEIDMTVAKLETQDISKKSKTMAN